MKRHLVAAVVIAVVAAGALYYRKDVGSGLHSGSPVEIRTGSSTRTLAPGDQVTLTLDVLPRRGIHVYGPGAEGYIALALVVDPQPFVQLLATRYPPPVVRKLAWAENAVPLYSGLTTLTLPMTIDDSPEARAKWQHTSDIHVTGTVRYQACDDRLCYEPVSMPVSWKFTL